jgi:predicted nucleotidyltransferase
MTRDWEAWLQTAARPASATEEAERDSTLARVRRAIEQSSEINSSSVSVYVKGSYASNTNVRRDSDVDVAVEWTDWYFVDRAFDAVDKTPAELGYTPIDVGPTPMEFRAQIERALQGAFGVAVDTTGDKAINVTRTSGTLDADVIPCFELHRYDAPGRYHVGHRIYPKSGGFINNFPQQNLDNGRAKNNRTTRRYKQIVRCLKRLEGELVADGKIAREYPGYLVECLLYNVSDVLFTSEPTLLETLRNCLAILWSGLQKPEKYNEWVEVSGLLMLFRGWHGERDPQEALQMVFEAWKTIGID